jgi:hypothetical protein
VLVLGLANSGKTTLVNCLMEAGDQEVVPTVGFSMEKVHFERCKLTVIDMSGQEKYQPLWEMHYTDAKVCSMRGGSNLIHGSVVLTASCQGSYAAAVQHNTQCGTLCNQGSCAAAGTNR